jgi:hypothetical protein
VASEFNFLAFFIIETWMEIHFFIICIEEEEEEEYFIDQLRTNERHSNYNDYIYIYSVFISSEETHECIALDLTQSVHAKISIGMHRGEGQI